MRRHVVELCVEYAIVPLCREPELPRARPGLPAVALHFIRGPRGYWACLHDIGLAIADPACGERECERAAWGWAYNIALDVPTIATLDLISATLVLDEDGEATGQYMPQPAHLSR